MTDDRELLRLAAKAVGFARMEWREDTPYVSLDLDGCDFVAWNPLTDDGDALRLANDLEICIEFGYCLDDTPVVRCGRLCDRDKWPQEPNFPDQFAATRRAIVRAAAALAG